MAGRFLLKPYAPGLVMGAVLAAVSVLDSLVGGSLDALGWAALSWWALLSAAERLATPAWILTGRQPILRALQVCALGAFLAGAALVFWDLWLADEPLLAGCSAFLAGAFLSRWNPLVPGYWAERPPPGAVRPSLSRRRDDEIEL